MKVILLLSFESHIPTSWFMKKESPIPGEPHRPSLLPGQPNRTLRWLLQAIHKSPGNFGCKHIWQGCYSLGRSEKEAKKTPQH